MLANTLVKDWMTSPVIGVKPETPLSLAHKIMKDNGVRRLVVLDSEDRLLGIVTIGDVREASPSDATTLSIWELNYLWAQLTVEKIMTRDVRTVRAEDTIVTAAQIMLDAKVSGVPVLDESRRVVGMITESDVFRMVIKTLTTETAK